MVSYFGMLIVHLVQHEIGNLQVAGSSPTLGIGSHEPSIHPAARWVPVI